LCLTDQYTCVYLDSVDMSVHIIPRNNCENEYFVNHRENFRGAKLRRSAIFAGRRFFYQI
jgi:hypothetical protein